MRTLTVVNPAAGRGRGARRYAQVAAALRTRWPGPVELTTAKGDARKIAESAAHGGVRLLVVVGGDGTVHEVVNGLATTGFDGIVAYVPTGTGCDLARTLGFPSGAQATVAALASAVPRALDLGLVRPQHGTPVWFVNAANVGIGPRIAARVDAWKGLGRLAYAFATAWELARMQPTVLGVPGPDGSMAFEPTLNVCICNGPYFGGGMNPEPSASPSSGYLHVVHARELGRLQALRLLPRLMRGRLGEHPALHRFGTTRLEIAGEGSIEADGEIVGRLPAIFEVVPAAWHVLAPPGRR